MEFIKLFCPYCGGQLSIENGIDTFYCQHCGGKIILSGQDKNTLNAKVKLKEFEHKERLQDAEHKHQERVQKSNQEYWREVNASKENTNRIGCLAKAGIILIAIIFGSLVLTVVTMFITIALKH